MQSKQAQVSALPMVLLVVIVCIVALILFYGHAKKISDQTEGIKSPGEIILEKQRTETLLRVLSEEAIAKSYVETIADLSETRAFIINDGASHVSLLDTSNPTFNEDYLSSFKKHVNENLIELIKDYPSQSVEFKDAVIGSEIFFDGNNIKITSNKYLLTGNSGGVNSRLEVNIEFSTSLDRLELADLNLIKKSRELCTQDASFETCFSESIPEFEVNLLEVYLTQSTEPIELVNLTSKKSYFVGTETLARPNMFMYS